VASACGGAARKQTKLSKKDVNKMRGKKIGRMEQEGCQGEAEAHRDWRWESPVSAGFGGEIRWPGGEIGYGVWCNEGGRGGV
jgi:hypothetical protein